MSILLWDTIPLMSWCCPLAVMLKSSVSMTMSINYPNWRKKAPALLELCKMNRKNPDTKEPVQNYMKPNQKRSRAAIQ